MRIGIACTLKPDGPTAADAPDDLNEEFDSPATVEAIAAVFRSLGHTAHLIGDGRPLVESLLKNPPDLVFNFAEGSGISRSREARVPAVCEMLGVPYTGSDPLALAVALDKDMTRRGSRSRLCRASTTATSRSSRRSWRRWACRCRSSRSRRARGRARAFATAA
jgi:D-alanine-D-alanine ligase